MLRHQTMHSLEPRLPSGPVYAWAADMERSRTYTAQQAQKSGCRSPRKQVLKTGTHRWVEACPLQRGLEHSDQQIIRQRILQAAALRLREGAKSGPTRSCRPQGKREAAPSSSPIQAHLGDRRAQCADDYDVVHAGRAALVRGRVASGARAQLRPNLVYQKIAQRIAAYLTRAFQLQTGSA